MLVALRGFREVYPPKIEIATSINLMIFVTNSITAEAQSTLLVTTSFLTFGSWPGVFSSLLRGARLLSMTYLLHDVRGPHVMQNGVRRRDAAEAHAIDERVVVTAIRRHRQAGKYRIPLPLFIVCGAASYPRAQ